MSAINEQAAKTGINAALSSDGSEIILTNATGNNIVVGDTTNANAAAVTVTGYDAAGASNGTARTLAADANAEFVAEVRKIFEENDVRYQIAELGKVDIGGGGTIAYILANKGIDVIDCGVPVLSMHSPYEVTSKLDLYEAHRGYEAFWKNA